MSWHCKCSHRTFPSTPQRCASGAASEKPGGAPRRGAPHSLSSTRRLQARTKAEAGTGTGDRGRSRTACTGCMRGQDTWQAIGCWFSCGRVAAHPRAPPLWLPPAWRPHGALSPAPAWHPRSPEHQRHTRGPPYTVRGCVACLHCPRHTRGPPPTIADCPGITSLPVAHCPAAKPAVDALCTLPLCAYRLTQPWRICHSTARSQLRTAEPRGRRRGAHTSATSLMMRPTVSGATWPLVNRARRRVVCQQREVPGQGPRGGTDGT